MSWGEFYAEGDFPVNRGRGITPLKYSYNIRLSSSQKSSSHSFSFAWKSVIASRASSFTRPLPLFCLPFPPLFSSPTSITCHDNLPENRGERRRFSFSTPSHFFSPHPLLTSHCENTASGSSPLVSSMNTAVKKKVQNPCQIQNKETCYFCHQRAIKRFSGREDC